MGDPLAEGSMEGIFLHLFSEGYRPICREDPAPLSGVVRRVEGSISREGERHDDTPAWKRCFEGGLSG